MPLYEFECPVHGLFEKIYSVADRPEKSDCPNIDEDFEDCMMDCPIQVSIPTMKPDKHWAGTITENGKYVTSDKEYKREVGHLVPATKETKEYIQKKRLSLSIEREQSKSDKLERFLGNQLASVAIDGNTSVVSEINKQNRMRRE